MYYAVQPASHPWPLSGVKTTRMLRSLRRRAPRVAAAARCRTASAASAVAPLRGSYGLWIGGEEVPSESGKTIPVENPLDGSILTRVSGGNEVDIARAVGVATEAFDDGRWSGMQPNSRARVLNKTAEILRSRIPEMARIESLSTGRPIREYMVRHPSDATSTTSWKRRATLPVCVAHTGAAWPRARVV